jgi:hypothetical protein
VQSHCRQATSIWFLLADHGMVLLLLLLLLGDCVDAVPAAAAGMGTAVTGCATVPAAPLLAVGPGAAGPVDGASTTCGWAGAATSDAPAAAIPGLLLLLLVVVVGSGAGEPMSVEEDAAGDGLTAVLASEPVPPGSLGDVPGAVP